MMRIWLVVAICMLVVASNVKAAADPSPVAVPYAAERSLLATDYVRIDWKDASRDRQVLVKIYFPSEAAGPFPVILFSHGLGGTRETYEYLGRQWAAHGYVSIHLQHPGSDDSAWRGQARPMQSMREAITLKNVQDRVADVKYVLDRLEALDREHARLKGKLDRSRIGMSGHSFGAQTTLMLSGQKLGGSGPIGNRLSAGLSDERIKAAIPMSAGLPSLRADLDGMFSPVRLPIFYMTGTLDDSPLSDTSAAERRLAFDHTRGTGSTYLLTLNGGDHMVFSGRGSVAERPTDETFQKLIRVGATAFWDAHLKNDPTARKWLDDGGYRQSLASDGVFERK